MTEQTGSIPDQTPEPAAPAAPTEGTPPNPAPSAEATPPAAPAAPAEGTPPATPPEGTPPAAPAEPAPATPPAAPRESAIQKRAREAREKANGLLGLADKLDPQAPPAPAPTPPAAPAQPAAPNLEPDYFDEEGSIDPVKHADWSRRVARAEAQAIVAENNRSSDQKEAQRQLSTAVNSYADEVESDATNLAASVDELNPSSDKYDQALDEHIEQTYYQMTHDSKGNLVRIDIPLKAFADQQVALARRYKTAAAAAVPNSVTAQGQDGAITPGARKETGAPTQAEIDAMSADDYEAYLKQKGTKTVQR